MLHITFILRFISASKGLLVDRECDMGYIYIYDSIYIYVCMCIYTATRQMDFVVLYCCVLYCILYCVADVREHNVFCRNLRIVC